MRNDNNQFHYASTSFYHRGCGSPLGGWKSRDAIRREKLAKIKNNDKGSNKNKMGRKPRRSSTKKRSTLNEGPNLFFSD